MTSRHIWLVLAFCSILTTYSIAEELDQNKFEYSIDAYGIYKTNKSTGEIKLFFESQGLYKASLSVSPNDTIVAIVITERGIVPPGSHDYSVLPKNHVLFLDPDGFEISRLNEDIRVMSWSPDGQKIAFITGSYYEGGVGFRTTGVWVFDLPLKRKTQINKDFPHKMIEGFTGGGFDIYWAKHDSNIYIEDFDYLDGIYRYDTKKQVSEKVQLKGIHFSPDGKYYFAAPNEARGRSLYKTEDNQDITERVKTSIGFLPFTWRIDSAHHLQIIEIEYEKFPNSTDDSEISDVRLVNKRIKQKTIKLYDVALDSIVASWTEVQ